MISNKVIAGLVLSVSLLLVWRSAYSYSCFVLLIPVIVSIIITYGVAEDSIKRRECISNCYFKEKSWLYGFYRSKIFQRLVAFVISLILSITLLAFIVTTSWTVTIIFVVDSIVIYLLYIRFDELFGNTINDNMRPTVIKKAVIGSNAFALIVILALIQYNGYVPSYVNASLNNTIHDASSTVFSQCNIVNVLVKGYVELESFGWWTIIAYSKMEDNSNLKIVVWMLFLLNGSLSVWAYSRYITQIIDFINIFEKRNYE